MIKKELFLLMAIFLSLSIGNAQNFSYLKQGQENIKKQTRTVFLDEGFENNETNLPIGWVSERTVGTTAAWTVVAATTGVPNTANSGSYKAYLHITTASQRAKLISPQIDLTGAVSPQLTFWHNQRMFGGRQDTLRVYYKNSEPGVWNLLVEYTNQVYDWEKKCIILPNPTANYWVAFENTTANGRGVSLDDVKIENSPQTPTIFVNPIKIGTVYNNLPMNAVRKFIVRNDGGTTLTVNNLVSATTGLTVQGLPLTIAPFSEQELTITLDHSAVEEGSYTGNIVLASSDPTTPQLTVEVTAMVADDAVMIDYKYETFSDAAVPPGWQLHLFQRNAAFGFDNGPCLRAQCNREIDANGCFGVQYFGKAITPYINMGSNPKLSFNYYASQVFATMPVTENSLIYRVYISQDNGNYASINGLQDGKPYSIENWELIDEITLGAHVPSSNFKFVEVDVSAYANKLCIVSIEFTAMPGHRFNVHLDDIAIGTPPQKELEALSISGTYLPTVGMPTQYSVSVKNNGYETQTNYTVKLFKEGSIELASLTGVEVAYLETKEITFEWTPDVAGLTYLYAEVILANDELPANNTTANFEILVQPTGFIGINVGNGTEVVTPPYDFNNQYSIIQTLYYASELGANGGEISGLTYNASISYDGPNLVDVPIRIWIGETDRESTTTGWVVPTDFIEVFNGEITFPQGIYYVFIPLDIPYQYNGGTLVVHSYRGQTGLAANSRFIGSTDPARSRGWVGSAAPAALPAAPNAGQIYNMLPNTTILFNFDGMGSLTGIVDDGTDPVEGAEIRIAETNLYVTTNANGKYTIPYLIPNTYEIVISKFGYVTQTANITITEDAVTTQNITLELVPAFEVSGKVTGNDAPGGLENVEITLFGPVNYTTFTDENGDYLLSEVIRGYTYQIKAKLLGYEIYRDEIEVNSDIVHDITLNEKLYPVYNPVAVKEDDNVVITWGEAGTFVEKLYQFDDGTMEGGAGYLGQNFWRGNKFPVNEIGELTSIDVFGYRSGHAIPGKTVRIDIFDEERQLIGSSDPFELTEGWVNVPLDEIPFSGTFYVMIYFSHGGELNNLGTDSNGPYASAGLSYAIINGEWGVYNVFGPALFFIRARGNSFGTVEVFGKSDASNISSVVYGDHINSDRNDIIDFLTEPINAESLYISHIANTIKATSSSRALLDHTVYRLAVGQPEEEWTLIADNVSELTCTDTDWSGLPSDAYRYAVKVNYDRGSSIPRLTNTLGKDMEVQFTVNLTTDTGILPVGAKITLTNQSGNPAHVYVETATGATVEFPEVWKGTYNITVRLEDFKPYMFTGKVIDAEGLSHDINLERILYPVKYPVASIVGNNAVITWQEPGIEPKTYILDDGSAESGWRINADASASMGNLFEVGESGELISIEVYGRHDILQTNRRVTVDIYNEQRQLLGSSAPFILGNDAWVTVPLDNIPYSGTFFAMVNWPATSGTTNHLGADKNGPYSDASLDYYRSDNGVWFVMHTIPGLQDPTPQVFLIRANALVSGKSVNYGYNYELDSELNSVTINESEDINSENTANYSLSLAPKSWTNFSVYRLIEGALEENWTLLSNNVTEFTYSDTGWETLMSGFYQWAIKTNYSTGTSAARLTNTLAKDMEVEFTLILTTNSGDPVAGAEIILTNQNGNPDFVYTKIATSSDVIFPEVRKGTYNIKIKLSGFATHNEVIEINTPFSYEITLDEVYYPVWNPIAAKVNNYVVISWEEPGLVPKTYILDDGTSENGWTINPNASASIGNIFEVGESGEITSVDLYAQNNSNNTNRPVWVDIYNSAQQLIGSSSVFNLLSNNWINVPLDNVPYSGTFYAMVNWPVAAGSTHYLGYDQNGPNANAGFNYYRTPTGQWIPSFHTATNPPSEPGVLMIRVNAELSGKSVSYNISEMRTENSEQETVNMDILENDVLEHCSLLLLPSNVSSEAPEWFAPQRNAPKSLQDYTVYRLIEGEPEEDWTLLSNNVSGLTYNDNAWNTILAGTYQWAVKANYTTGMSDARLTNALLNENPVTYTVFFNVFDSETNDPIEGATIVFDNETLTNYSVTNVLPGSYPYEVSKQGYLTAEGTVVVEDADVVIDVDLSAIGIRNNTLSNVNLYPNPFKDEINISKPELVKSIQITNAAGQIVREVIFDGKSINTAKLSSGVYFVVLENFSGEKLVHKMVK